MFRVTSGGQDRPDGEAGGGAPGAALYGEAAGGGSAAIDLRDDGAVIDLRGVDPVIDLTGDVIPVVGAGEAAVKDQQSPARPARRVPPRVSLAVLFVGTIWLMVLGAGAAALVVLAVLASVAFHEAAHLLAAQAVGVRAQEFFVGFGPRLWSMKKGGTEWGVKAIPAGGYVKLVHEQDAAPWRKAFIALAGPAANLVIALLLLVGVSVLGLLPTTSGTTAELPVGERVTAGADRFRDAALASVEPVIELPSTIVAMGRAIVVGNEVPSDSERLVSPIGIGRLADQASGAGWFQAIVLIAVVNLALGLFNLVPLPPLDGGRVLAAGLESVVGRVRRRRVNLMGKGFERIGLAVVVVLLVAGASAMVLDVMHPLGNPFAG